MFWIFKFIVLLITVLQLCLLNGCVKHKTDIILRTPENFAILRPSQHKHIFFRWKMNNENSATFYEFVLQEVHLIEYGNYWLDVVTTIVNGNEFSYPLRPLQGGRWRVRAITENGDGKWSDYYYFAIPQLEAIIHKFPTYPYRYLP